MMHTQHMQPTGNRADQPSQIATPTQPPADHQEHEEVKLQMYKRIARQNALVEVEQQARRAWFRKL